MGTSLDGEIPSFSDIVTLQLGLKGTGVAPVNQSLDTKLNELPKVQGKDLLAQCICAKKSKK